MIQNVGSKCKKHREKILIYFGEKQNKEEGKCSACLLQMLLDHTCAQLDKIIPNILDQEIVKTRSEKLIKNMNVYDEKNDIFIEKYGTFKQLEFRGKKINDCKIGEWKIFYNGVIGGGGKCKRNGLNEKEIIYSSSRQTVFEGKQNNEGGLWITSFQGKQIGGGCYDEKGVKQGVWIEIDDDFGYQKELTFKGEYKNGIKRGKWIHLFSGFLIGGCNYDENGVKQDEWINWQMGN